MFQDGRIAYARGYGMAGIAPGNLVRQVADVSLASRFTEATPVISGAPAGGDGPSALAPVSPPPGTRAPIADVVGTYYSTVDATFTIAVTGGSLTLRRDSDAEAARLDPTGPDQFRFRGMTIRFERSPTGEVKALVVDAGRVRGIRFLRR